MNSNAPVDHAALATSLAQLTSGWSPVQGLAHEILTTARQALASSILAGKGVSDIRAAPPSATAGTPVNPQLSAALNEIAAKAAATPLTPTIAVVRSSLAASLTNPTGLPDWARGAQVINSFGPFQDLHGALHWVDVIKLTVSTRFAFGNPSAPFAVFPVASHLIPASTPKHLSLGSGSVWFLAQLLASTFPAGTFTGFSVTGGTLDCSSPLNLQNGIYVVPPGATLTLTASLAAAAPTTSSGDPGADAAAARFTPPSNVTIVFKPTNATFQNIADCSVTAYGTTVSLHRNHEAPVVSPELHQIVIPCDPSRPDFVFSTVASGLFGPSGIASISHAGWGLPLAATNITALPEAAGPGACVLQLHTGASIETEIQAAPDAVSTWIIEIATGGLFALALGKGRRLKFTYQLWPEAAPSKRASSVDVSVGPSFSYAFLSSSTNELLLTNCDAVAHVDRPITATGSRIPYQSEALLMIDRAKSGDVLVLVAGRKDQAKPIISIALENALLGVNNPALFTLAGKLQGKALHDCIAGFYFNLRWLLPTLPDPYAANFDATSVLREAATASVGTLVAVTSWAGAAERPKLNFILLPASTTNNSASGNALESTTAAGATAIAGTPFTLASAAEGDRVVAARTGRSVVGLALLDLSTRVDLFGVAFAQSFRQLVTRLDRERIASGGQGSDASGGSNLAPAIGFVGMSLALNGAAVATFALPQVSWEPMESTATDQPGPIVARPASDGWPLLIAAPDVQTLVPFIPSAVLTNNIENVAAGLPFSAMFSLPFGLNAIIVQPNKPLPKRRLGAKSTFIAEGGRFYRNKPQFPFVLPASPPTNAQPITPPAGTSDLTGAVQLTVMPRHPNRTDAAFAGATEIEHGHGPTPPGGYGVMVLGADGDVAKLFDGDFSASGSEPSVPLRRIDFSGYGASIFSEWIPEKLPPVGIIKVQFETTIGRTAYEVIKAASVIYPYCIRVVRTVTMQRQNAGWVQRSDTGWQAASQGLFEFPDDSRPTWNGRIHRGPLAGVYNIRNIRDVKDTPSVSVPPFEYRKVLFDADLGIDPGLKVRAGGFTTPIAGVANPPVLVASRDMIGYLQLAPESNPPQSPKPDDLRGLFAQIKTLHPTIACTIEAGSFGGEAGTVLRSSAFDVDMLTAAAGGAGVPALGVALRGAPQIPTGGGWSLGHRRFTDPAPSALPKDFPVPLVRPAGTTDFWYIADLADILQLAQPDNFYSLMHSTGTHKVLFESPQIPTSAAMLPPSKPGLQFPKPNPPGPPKPGAAPQNPGSPNLGDLASILNSTGLFPDIGSALTLIGAELEQLKTIKKGIKYQKKFTFDPNQQVPILHTGLLDVTLQYADTTPIGALDTTHPAAGMKPAELNYFVDSANSPSWSLEIGTLSMLVTMPPFGTKPLLTITGNFRGDEHTPPGLKDLNIQFGDALSIVKQVFSKLNAIAQYLPGGAGANLDIALANQRLTVRDSFTIADFPLGVGNLTDVSLNLGLTVALQPLSVDFSVGLGSPEHPFNWIVSPLAGNGLMILGITDKGPNFTIQAGIGLGLAIDLGIASGSASVVIAFQLEVAPPAVQLMAILTGQASVDVLDGLASATLMLSAGLGFRLDPMIPPIKITPTPPALPPQSITIGSELITLLATCSVGIHISICWVVNVGWDGSWEFSQSVSTPELTVSI